MLGPFAGGRPAPSMVNWTFVFNNYAPTRTSPTTSAGPATRRRSRERSRGRRSAASTSGSARSPPRQDFAIEAVQCITSERTRCATRSRRRTCRRAGGLRRRRAARAVPGRPARAVPAEHRHGRPAAGVAVLGDDRQRDAPQVAPGRLGEPVTRPRRSRPPSSSRPSRGRCCCDHHGARRPAPMTAEAVAARGHHPTARGREPARLEAGGPAVVMMLAGHGVPDVPGAVPLAVPLPAHGAGRQASSSASELRHRADRLAVVAGRLEHRGHHGRDRRGRARDRLRLRHGDAPDHLRPGRHPDVDPDPLRHHHRRLGVRLAVRLQPQQRLRQRLVAVRSADYNWFGAHWPAMFAIIVSEIWKTTPFMSLLLLAGLRRSPRTCSRPPRSTAPPGGSDCSR